MIALAIPLTVGAYVLSHKITIAFFGQAFAPAAQALWLLVAAVSVLFIYVPVNSLIVSQRTKIATIITGFNLLFNLGLNLLLIPKFGFVVAAVVTLASETIQLIGYTFIVQTKIIAFPYFRHFVKPIVAGGVMGGVIYYFLNHNLWLLIGLGGLVYSLVLVALGFFQREDLAIVKAAFNFNKKLEPDIPPLENL
jgi:O-antigen/teichoic acid export membrane protein